MSIRHHGVRSDGTRCSGGSIRRCADKRGYADLQISDVQMIGKFVDE
jgi:hypothetical protein